ncbi:hypothetical protein H7H82_18925, partial [Mycobacterium heidelbergense]|nr:hypothetical protein [Mycobacterium heidelbergense]
MCPLDGHATAAVFDAGTHRLAVLAPGADAAAPASLTEFGDPHDAPRVVAITVAIAVKATAGIS